MTRGARRLLGADIPPHFTGRGHGRYLNEAGDVIREASFTIVADITAFDAYNGDNTPSDQLFDKLCEDVAQWCTDWHQEAVAVTFGGTTYLVKP